MYETIVRSMCYHLALLPDFTLAKAAETLYSTSNSAQGLPQGNKNPDWEDVFTQLLDDGPSQSQFVFLIDALDECDRRDVERLLDFMKTVVDKRSNTRLLCSSHQHVRVRAYFRQEVLQEVEVTTATNKDEMSNFITRELLYLRDETTESVFCE